jgi:uncharacterized sporulation protein YeaH/YhbH (DUF444 family)
MKTILKITFISLAVIAFNSVSAQNALTKRNIKKAETTSVKSHALSVDTKEASGVTTNTAVERQAQNSISTHVAPTQAKSVSVTQAKTPAKMASKPLQKKTVVQHKAVAEPKSVIK